MYAVSGMDSITAGEVNFGGKNIAKMSEKELADLRRKLGIIDIADNDINEVMEELVKLNKEGTTIMMVTHDAKVASRCSRVLYIVDGNIKGEYISPKDADMKEKDRERLLNNWLMELGW